MSAQLHLNLNVVGAGAHTGAWRWPGADPLTFAHVGVYQDAARLAERGSLDAVFFADTPSLRSGIHSHPQLQGIEPTVLATAVAAVTERVGLIATLSTTFNEPYNVARRMQSLDVVSAGRAAWNVVVSGTPEAALNFDPGLFVDKAARYVRAEEFVDVVVGLWKGWHPDAIVADQASGAFADPDLVRALNHAGENFTVRGPLTLPPSPQGYPVLFQAGGSDSGRHLAARTADAIFTTATTIEGATQYRNSVHEDAALLGRRPEELLVLPGLITIIGGTEEEARTRHHELQQLAVVADQLDRLGFALQVDVAKLRVDRPIDPSILPHDLSTLLASQGNYRAIEALVRQGLTVAEIIERTGTGGHRIIVGTPEQVAADIISWHRADSVDGFNIMPDVVSDGAPAFVEHVVPLLQRAGVFRSEYEHSTLRGHYGLPAVSFEQ